MVRAALQLSDSDYTRIERKTAKNTVVIHQKFCYPKRKKENKCHFQFSGRRKICKIGFACA